MRFVYNDPVWPVGPRPQIHDLRKKRRGELRSLNELNLQGLLQYGNAVSERNLFGPTSGLPARSPSTRRLVQ